jgi:hypothetical protein
LILVNAQISEMQAVQQSIFDLDRIHTKMKQQYEEEIKRLRFELEQRGIPLPSSSLPDSRSYRKQSILPEGVPPPNLSSSGRSHGVGAFGSIMGQGSASYSHHGYPGTHLLMKIKVKLAILKPD